MELYYPVYVVFKSTIDTCVLVCVYTVPYATVEIKLYSCVCSMQVQEDE